MKLRSVTLASALALLACTAFADDGPALPELPIVNNARVSLKDALRIASANNLTLRQTQADADAASANARSAQAQTKPSLSTTTYGTAGDSSNILTSSPGVMPQNVFSVAPRGFADQNLMLMVPLYTSGRLERNAAAARQQNQAAAFSVRAAGLMVTQNVSEGYADAALQQALVDVAQARVTAEDEQVRVTGERVKVGRNAPVDLLREQAEQADARQALLAAQNNAALALVTLKTALGISQLSKIALSDTLDTLTGASPPVGDLQNALHQADTQRPELAAALRQVEAAHDAVKAAQGADGPQVYAVAMADAMTGAGIGRTGYTVGLTASLPLYDGGQRRADVEGAKARLDRAAADALQARQMVDQQAASAWLTLQTAAAQVEAAGAGATAAQEAFRLADLRYSLGKSVTAERLDSLAALVRAQGTLARAKADLVVARSRLKAALGGG